MVPKPKPEKKVKIETRNAVNDMTNISKFQSVSKIYLLCFLNSS